MIIFALVLLSVLVLGFITVIGWAVLDIASDEITPIMEGLGMVGDVNLSEASQYSFGVADTFVQAMPWLIAFGYVMALVFTLVFVFVVGYNPHPAFIALYVALIILIIFGCIVISNMYQDIIAGDDDVADRLAEQTIMTFLIIHSPLIIGFVAIMGGILMFTMRAVSEGAPVGGFGI